jgi:group I intron endonuclease
MLHLSSLDPRNLKSRIEGVGCCYFIRCRAAWKYYVGSTVDFDYRQRTHFNELRKGVHHSYKLQKAWEEYGEDSFEMTLIDEYWEEDLRESEDFWVKHYNSYHNGYNCTDVIQRGVPLTEEQKRVLSESAKKAGQDPELRTKRSENAKKQHARKKLGQATWLPGTAKIVGSKLKGRKRDILPCSICGEHAFLLENGVRFCFKHDPIPERNDVRNESRRRAQKAIPPEERKMKEETKTKLSEVLKAHWAKKLWGKRNGPKSLWE